MDDAQIEDLADLDKDNFWFRVKQRYLKMLITTPKASILDVGCGSGGNMMDFLKRGYTVVGIDKNDTSLEHCQKRGLRVIKMDINKEEKINLDFIPDYITMLDFIEHLNDPISFLKKIKGCCGPSSKLIITVPAHSFLWSAWDECMGHVKRYSPSLLKKEIELSGWQLDRISYTNILLFLPAIIQRKIFQPLMKVFLKRTCKEQKFFNPWSIVNKIMFFLYKGEFFLFKFKIKIPMGLSIIAIAKPSKLTGDAL